MITISGKKFTISLEVIYLDSVYKVMVVDDQNIARSFFEMHVKASKRYELVYSIGNTESAVRYCDENQVDLVLMDILTSRGSEGLDAARRIKERHPAIKIIMVTSMPEASWIARSKEIGAESFWYKEYGEEPLREIMDRTMAGESVYPEDYPVIKLGNATREDFTERELEVLREMTIGLTNSEIAEKLCISPNSVHSHVAHLLANTGYTSRTRLAVDARVLGLVINPRGNASNS